MDQREDERGDEIAFLFFPQGNDGKVVRWALEQSPRIRKALQTA
jgi:hypothetical protein